MSVDKQAVVDKYGTHSKDTGATRVQIALLTSRIGSLTAHFQNHTKDHHGRRGLLLMVSKRKRLLEYLRRTDLDGYRQLIAELGLRH